MFGNEIFRTFFWNQGEGISGLIGHGLILLNSPSRLTIICTKALKADMISARKLHASSVWKSKDQGLNFIGSGRFSSKQRPPGTRQATQQGLP